MNFLSCLLFPNSIGCIETGGEPAMSAPLPEDNFILFYHFPWGCAPQKLRPSSPSPLDRPRGRPSRDHRIELLWSTGTIQGYGIKLLRSPPPSSFASRGSGSSALADCRSPSDISDGSPISRAFPACVSAEISRRHHIQPLVSTWLRHRRAARERGGSGFACSLFVYQGGARGWAPGPRHPPLPWSSLEAKLGAAPDAK